LYKRNQRIKVIILTLLLLFSALPLTAAASESGIQYKVVNGTYEVPFKIYKDGTDQNSVAMDYAVN